MKINDKVNVSDGVIVSFLIGFAYNRGTGMRLGAKIYRELIDKINFRICNSVNKEIFLEIENEIFEKKNFIPHIYSWDKLCNEEKLPQVKIKQRLFLENVCNSTHKTKITSEMIFAFFCGISNSIPSGLTKQKFYEVNEMYLNKIGREFCDDVDMERLCDLENFLNSNYTLYEIRDAIMMASGEKPEWSYPKNFDPHNDDDAMLRRFQEENK